MQGLASQGAVSRLQNCFALSMLLDLYCCRGNRLCGGDQRALRSPFGNLRSAHPCFLIFMLQGEIASTEATRGLSDRPLDPFGSPLPELTFSAAGGIAPVGAIEGCTHRFGSSVRISLIDMQYGSASWLRPCSSITCAVFCIAGKALRIRWLAWMTMFTPCAASSSSVVRL